VLPALSCGQILKIFVKFPDVSTTLNFARSWMCIVFTRVAGKIAALITSEEVIVCATEEGIAMAVCAVASVGPRGRVLEASFFIGLGLGTVQEMLDRSDVDGFRAAGWRKICFVRDDHAKRSTETLLAVHVTALVD
jgi:hypothetical protein